MTKAQLAKKKLPEAPGVYFFLGSKKEILYIGKATSLKSRVRSYFDDKIAEKRSKLIEKMVDEARTIEWTKTDSVLEALILESNLIRTHKPKFNSLAKDDKSYNHLIITNEAFPRVLVVRGKDLVSTYTEDTILYHFGPFTSGVLFREALKIVRKLFKFYDTKVAVGKERSKLARGTILFNTQIGLYPSEQNKNEYLKTIRYIKLFFEGKKMTIVRELEKEMMAKARKERFEEADMLKKKVFALRHIEDVALIKNDFRKYADERSIRIEAYDVAHLGGKDMVGVMTVVEGSERKNSEYRMFKIKSVIGSNDTASLSEILTRRLLHDEWLLPQLIVVDGSTAQKNAAERVLRKRELMIPVVAVVKDEHHKPIKLVGAPKLIAKHQDAILLSNAEAHRFSLSFHKKLRDGKIKKL
jgi:excinuclease ABC subunit C